MDAQIRSERLQDHNPISDVNCEAFDGWQPNNGYISKPVMAGLPGQGKKDDSYLPLIAEIAGDGSGHILFSIYQFIVAGTAQQNAVPATAVIKPVFRKRTGVIVPIFIERLSLQKPSGVHAA